ncbi:MAG TPA: GntR family transcriptional regulator [Ilumatobacteraceae bacterium]|nr:GntR family transcriptional regulator [Ilumatobacteraceae bacterium]
MIVSPVPRKSVSDAIYEQLRDAIIGDSLRVGELLPPERELAQQAGVNRQAVREALQRLRQMHLVEIVHGGGARVREWRMTADISLLPELVTAADGSLQASPALSLTHLRVALGTDIARLAARNVTTDRTMNLRNALAAMRMHYGIGAVDSRSIVVAIEDVWTVLAEMSENVAYRLTNTAMRVAALEYLQIVPGTVTPIPEQLEMYERLVNAVLSSDEDTAAITARTVLDATRQIITGLMARVEDSRATLEE